MRWIVLLSVCLHVTSASFDYVYDEQAIMGKQDICVDVADKIGAIFLNEKPNLPKSHALLLTEQT